MASRRPTPKSCMLWGEAGKRRLGLGRRCALTRCGSRVRGGNVQLPGWDGPRTEMLSTRRECASEGTPPAGGRRALRPAVCPDARRPRTGACRADRPAPSRHPRPRQAVQRPPVVVGTSGLASSVIPPFDLWGATAPGSRRHQRPGHYRPLLQPWRRGALRPGRRRPRPRRRLGSRRGRRRRLGAAEALGLRALEARGKMPSKFSRRQLRELDAANTPHDVVRENAARFVEGWTGVVQLLDDADWAE